jgi:CheY-like chemotaxis protein
VLIVEDNPITQETLTRDLGALDLQTHAVPSAEEAWDYLGRATPPDVIILDFHLPGEDGSSLYRRVNSDPRFGKTAIIPFTALADMSNNSQEAILTLQRGLDAGAGSNSQGILSKGGNEEVRVLPGALLLAIAHGLRTAGRRCPSKLMAAIRDYLKQFSDDAANDPISGWAYFLHLKGNETE